jgi:hypothetical protein
VDATGAGEDIGEGAEQQLAVLAGPVGVVSPRGFRIGAVAGTEAPEVSDTIEKVTKRPTATRYAGDLITLSLHLGGALFGEWGRVELEAAYAG